jgi:hypothetical protein
MPPLSGTQRLIVGHVASYNRSGFRIVNLSVDIVMAGCNPNRQPGIAMAAPIKKTWAAAPSCISPKVSPTPAKSATVEPTPTRIQQANLPDRLTRHTFLFAKGYPLRSEPRLSHTSASLKLGGLQQGR